ncbi:MAG: sulfatase-like hydrolase/transferase [Polyangiales bacterium]
MGLLRNTTLRSRWDAWRVLSPLIRFWICGIGAWALLLALELRVERPGPAELWNRAQYAISLASRFSVLCVLPLWAAHGLRLCWLRTGRRADLRMTLLIAALLIPPSYRQADLLTSGGLLLESQLRELGLWLIFAALLAANLALWHVHLVLSGAPAHRLGSALRRLLQPPGRRSLRWLGIGLSLVLGVGSLALFSDFAPRKLRAYLFFSQFLLPSAFVLAASLLYALQRRAAIKHLAPLVLGLLVTLIAARSHPFGMHRAKAFFERRGALIALTELSSTSTPGTSYANVDVSDPSRFHCQPRPAAPSPPTPRPKLDPNSDRRNVILISIDTLRKDALEMKLPDTHEPAAPHLRAIAARSLSFERAVTTYPATLFAMSSALSGQSASEVMFAPKPPDNLFTVTRSHFQDMFIALPSASWFQQRPVPQLFTQNVRPAFFPDAEHTTQHAIARLREARSRKRRIFGWVHYYEPHGSRATGRGSARENALRSYGALVHGVDTQVGKLWSELERLGYLRDSLIVVFSDHGEALGELDYFGHHVYLNQFATDIPLLVHAPGVAPRKLSQLALLSDIAQTVVEWLGLPATTPDTRNLLTLGEQDAERYGISEAFPVRGRALYNVARVPIKDTATLADRIALTRTAAIDYQPKVALVSARHRLIVNRVTGATELYDRVADPGEKRDLSTSPLPEHTHMREVLRARMRELSERIYCRVQDAVRGSEPEAPPVVPSVAPPSRSRAPDDPGSRLRPLVPPL